MKYHHLGIPTKEKLRDEQHLKHLKMYVSGYGKSPYGVEWTRYEDDAPYPELVKTVPHVAFEVDDILEVIRGKKVIRNVHEISYPTSLSLPWIRLNTAVV